MENIGKTKGGSKASRKGDSSSSTASKNDETVVVKTQTQPSVGEEKVKEVQGGTHLSSTKKETNQKQELATGAPDLSEAHEETIHDLMETDNPPQMDDAVPMVTDPPAPQLREDLMPQLQTTQLSPVEETLIETLLGSDILQKARVPRSVIGGYFVSSDGFVSALTWQTFFSEQHLCEPSWQSNLGWIRNQKHHLFCWDYVSTDLVSAENVRMGWEDEYHPLSAWHLGMSCRTDLLGNDKRAPLNHMCYGYEVYFALQYMKYFGAPPKEGNPDFDCNAMPIPSTSFNERIESVLRFDVLEEALYHLPVTPIAADLICYSNLFHQGEAVYYGPLKENVSFRGYHAVIIVAIRWYREDYVAMCKMSNGPHAGHKGYVYVSLTTMYMIVGIDSTRIPFVRPTPKPHHLLSNFVCLRMCENKRRKKNVKPASTLKPEVKEKAKHDSRIAQRYASSSQPQEAEPEYFKEKRILEDLWKAAFPVGTEWDQHDAIYEVDWDFKNVEEALEEGGKLHGKKVYVFGCAESQLVHHKNENKTVIVPTVVCIESTIHPSDKIVASVQGEVEEIIPMKDIEMAWIPYTPLEKRDKKIDEMDFQIFILDCTQRRFALKHLKEDRLKKFNYCLPYIYNPFKEDESEQSTMVQITFPSEPPVVCEYDWAIDNLEELTDDLMKKEALLMDQKDEFNEFVKGQSEKAKTAYGEVKQAGEKAKEGMSEETKKAYEEMKLYKFYPLPVADIAGINKSSIINKYLGKAHEVF